MERLSWGGIRDETGDSEKRYFCGQKVMLDRDLAELYGVTTGNLNKAVKRNIERFEGDDFMFELTNDEYNSLLNSMRFQN